MDSLPYVCVYFTYALKVYECTVRHMMCLPTCLCVMLWVVCTYVRRFVRGVCDKMDGSCLLSHKVEKSKVCSLVSSPYCTSVVVVVCICGFIVHHPSLVSADACLFLLPAWCVWPGGMSVFACQCWERRRRLQ